MAKIVNDEIYLETQEVLDYLHMTKPTFYRNVRPYVKAYPFDGKSKPWYKKTEIAALAEGKLEERPPITISGILRNWTEYVRGLGLQIDTQLCNLDTGVSLSQEICAWLGVPESTPFLKSRKISFIEQRPICTWITAYPLVLVHPFLDTMKHTIEFDMVKAIKESRGITIKSAKDRYKARPATQFEQELLQLRRDEPILQLQRAAYSEMGKLVLYSDMSLLGSWFAPELSYPVDIW